MGNSKDIGELVDQFLSGEMSNSELKAFEVELGNNQALSEELSFQQMLEDIVIEERLLGVGNQINSDLSSNVKLSKYSKIKKGVFALSATLVLTGGAYFYNTSEKVQTNDEIDLVVKEVFKDDPVQEEIYVENLNPTVEPDLAPSPNLVISIIEKEPPIKVPKTLESLNQEKVVSVDSVINIDEPKEVQQNKIVVLDEDSLKKDRKPVINCPDMFFEIQEQKSCDFEATGQVFISKNLIKGGRPPFQFSLDGEKYFDENLFTNLRVGAYTIYIKDKDGCVSSSQTLVKGKPCGELDSYSFNPYRNDIWEVPTDEYDFGLSIKDKSGREIYTNQVSDGDYLGWDGRDNSGNILPIGLYLYIIRGEKIKQGYISIVD